jgi:hypothetical protein
MAIAVRICVGTGQGPTTKGNQCHLRWSKSCASQGVGQESLVFDFVGQQDPSMGSDEAQELASAPAEVLQSSQNVAHPRRTA